MKPSALTRLHATKLVSAILFCVSLVLIYAISPSNPDLWLAFLIFGAFVLMDFVRGGYGGARYERKRDLSAVQETLQVFMYLSTVGMGIAVLIYSTRSAHINYIGIGLGAYAVYVGFDIFQRCMAIKFGQLTPSI